MCNFAVWEVYNAVMQSYVGLAEAYHTLGEK
jgi:hypothetical protein